MYSKVYNHELNFGVVEGIYCISSQGKSVN